MEKVCSLWVLFPLLLLYLNSPIFFVPHSFISVVILSHPEQKKAFSKSLLKCCGHVRVSKIFPPKPHCVSNQCLLCITCAFTSCQACLWHRPFLNSLACFLLALAEGALLALWDRQSRKFFFSPTSSVTRSDYSSCTNNVGNGFFLH